MATIVYALSGQGRGHTSRATAIAEALRNEGHHVLFCCGGTARTALLDEDETVIPVPALRQVIVNNEVRLGKTMQENWMTVLRGPRIVRRLARTFADYDPALVITDFEPFAPRAAERIDVPVLSFDHQQMVTETRYPLPAHFRFDSMLAKSVISCITPRRPVHTLLTSFFSAPLKHPERTTLVPPILRTDVQQQNPATGEHVLVYYNEPRDTSHVPRALRRLDASFILYNVEPPPNPDHFPNITFKEPSRDGFLRDLAASRAVICTAGFTLISEALHLHKPLLVAPNNGDFEQTLNALALRRNGLGRAVFDTPLTADDVQTFLDQAPAYQAQLKEQRACGNDEAVACIEHHLPTTTTRPASPSPLEPVAA